MVHIYRQRYDIGKVIENMFYAFSSMACWGSLLVGILVASWVLGFFNVTETTLLGQLFKWIA